MPETPIADELLDLAERARAKAATAKKDLERARAAHEEADRLSRALQHAVEQATGKPPSRPPDVSNGESVDPEHLSRVREAREEQPA